MRLPGVFENNEHLVQIYITFVHSFFKYNSTFENCGDLVTIKPSKIIKNKVDFMGGDTGLHLLQEVFLFLGKLTVLARDLQK